jgi:hypothetical protein
MHFNLVKAIASVILGMAATGAWAASAVSMNVPGFEGEL